MSDPFADQSNSDVPLENVRVFRRQMLRWNRLHARSFPWRETNDLYAILIGELMLQRTRGEHVPEVFAEFIQRFPNPSALADAGLVSVSRIIRPLGLGKRAATLLELGRVLNERGEVPSRPQELAELPGVGPYISHAVPIFARNRNLPLVDWVIARVLRRYFGLAPVKRPNVDRVLWGLAEELIRAGRARRLWLGTLDFAAAICKPIPQCSKCPLMGSCAYAQPQKCDGGTDP